MEKTDTFDMHHYFDWAATTPPDDDILKSALEESLICWGNPSSTHAAGKMARDLLEKARKDIATVMAVNPSQLYFTSGGTESDGIPLLSLLTRQNRDRMHILVSGIEHPAIREQAAVLSRMGIKVDTISPNQDGFITPDAVLQALTQDTVFVAVMAVNNETGCVQPIYAIADAITEACRGKRRPHFHVDCVQAAGKIPLRISHAGIDSAAFSAHKICGPRGIGLLYLAKPITPFLLGGGQEQSVRSGTENLLGALAFSQCLERYWIYDNALADQNGRRSRLEDQQKWTRDFMKKLKALGAEIIPACRDEDKEAEAQAEESFSPWIVQAAFKGIPGNVMVRALDAKGFAISTGSACSAKKQSRPILAAMQVPREAQDTAVRFSFGSKTTKADMENLLQAVAEVKKAFSR